MELSILWIYIALLVAGGVMGFVKAKSKASLIASLSFAVPLVLAATGVLHGWVADIVLAILLVFFGKKYVISKKFMPSGLMAISSAIALVVRLLF